MRASWSMSPLHTLSMAMSVLLLTLCLLPQAVRAEGKIVSYKDLVFTKDQVARVRQLFSSVDAKMQAALKSDEALTKAMQAELKTIGSIKAPADQRKAIAAYQSKYAKSYELILKKSGVDLASIASQLNGIFPYLQFRAQPNFTVLARLHQALAKPTAPSTSPKVTTTDIKSSDYTDHKDLGCGAIGGSNVSFSSTRVTNSTFAAEVGGCGNSGEKTAKFDIPAGAISAHADAKAELSSESFAVGVAGTAISGGAACLGISGNNSAETECVSAVAAAPILWAASAEESIDPSRVGKDLQAGKHYEVEAGTSTSAVAIGVIAETHATAEVRDLDASYAVEQ